MDDEMPTTRPSAPAAEPTTSEAELSRIAREAVRQPADPRMDRQLARMGLTDGPDDDRRPSAAASAQQAAANAELVERLERRVRRLQIIVVLLVVAVVVLAVALVTR